MTPLFLKDCLVKVAADAFQAELSAVKFTPTASTATWKGLTPSSVHTAQGTATWVAELTYAQDWDTAASLSNYLHENEGQTKTFLFEPKAGGVGFTVSVTITPGAIGGAVDAFAESSVTLPCAGKPVKVPAV